MQCLCTAIVPSAPPIDGNMKQAALSYVYPLLELISVIVMLYNGRHVFIFPYNVS